MPNDVGRRLAVIPSILSDTGKSSQQWLNTGDLDVERFLSAMEKGSKVIKVRLGKQWNSTTRQFCLNRETRRIMMSKCDGMGKASSRPKYVDIREMKEVFSLDYKLLHTKIVDKWRKDKDLSQCDPAKVLIIYHGSQFVLSCLVVLMESVELCKTWIQGLNYLSMEILSTPYPLQIERWLRKEFYSIDGPFSAAWISVKDVKAFLRRIHCQVDSKRFRDLIQTSMKSSHSGSGANGFADSVFGLKEKLSFENFALLYRNLIYVHSLFSSSFQFYSEDNVTVPFQKFQTFLLSEQKDENAATTDNCGEFLRNYIKDMDPTRDTSEPYLTREEFIDFLFSSENTIWDGIQASELQDMTRPLCDYWIASSHNTYLTGDQLKSESTLEAYARALLMGCRSVELDCWDGAEGPPLEIVIYHGYTLTSKLNFPDVLKTIRTYAFASTDYPVILSIEDNCSLPFQRQMAHHFKDILGDLLVTSPVNPGSGHLPSPEELRGKIILKHKKLPRETDQSNPLAAAQAALDESREQEDLLDHPDTQRRGLLEMKNLKTGEWESHIFVLTTDKLLYSESTTRLLGDVATETTQDPNQPPAAMAEDEIDANNLNPDELHLSESWFHGRISREDAEKLLKESGPTSGNGLFLVRESTTFPGDYSLSFWHQRQVHHIRIKTTHVGGERKFYMLEKNKMDSLYELISHYQEKPLNTPKFTTILRVACPPLSVHLGQPWFAGDISRAKAEELLNQYPQDGAFLIRFSQGSSEAFTLSFREGGGIKHCRLKQEGRLFVVGTFQFENLLMLVEHYMRRPLYHGICLKYPVNPQTIENYSLNVSHAPVGSYMDIQSISQSVKVRSKFEYISKDPEELSFPANAVLINVNKDDADWWTGELDGRKGFFPRAYVDEVTAESLAAGAIQGGTESHAEGWVDLAGSTVEPAPAEREFAIVVKNSTAAAREKILLLSARDADDMEDWKNSILELIQVANDRVARIKRKETVMRIASELSDLVVYCQAVPFNPTKIPGNFYEMCSYSDSKHEKLVERGLIQFNQHQISRVYPNASRLTSNNFSPVSAWNSGVQMVALNYQTPDKAMQLNQGRYVIPNKGCGYVLKPFYMRRDEYNPNDKSTIIGNYPVTLTIQIIAGRHLFRSDKAKGTVSPNVEIEVVGAAFDCCIHRTESVVGNGLNPVWNHTVELDIFCPELALLRFSVQDEDFLGSDPFIGQLVMPVELVRSGYRSVQLLNAYSEPIELASLLVHVDKRPQNTDEITRINTIAQLRQRQKEVLPIGPTAPLVDTTVPPTLPSASSSSTPNPAETAAVSGQNCAELDKLVKEKQKLDQQIDNLISSESSAQKSKNGLLARFKFSKKHSNKN